MLNNLKNVDLRKNSVSKVHWSSNKRFLKLKQFKTVTIFNASSFDCQYHVLTDKKWKGLSKFYFVSLKLAFEIYN
mgnify:CR=1 FL=1